LNGPAEDDEIEGEPRQPAKGYSARELDEPGRHCPWSWVFPCEGDEKQDHHADQAEAVQGGTDAKKNCSSDDQAIASPLESDDRQRDCNDEEHLWQVAELVVAEHEQGGWR